MSPLTALALSFNNLLTKKTRTLLTAFAGSIGIIGIALILSLSAGVSNYIQEMERSTLSEYPLQISTTGVRPCRPAGPGKLHQRRCQQHQCGRHQRFFHPGGHGHSA